MNTVHVAFTGSYVSYLFLCLAENRHGSQNVYLQKTDHILEFVHCKLHSIMMIIISHTFYSLLWANQSEQICQTDRNTEDIQ